MAPVRIALVLVALLVGAGCERRSSATPPPLPASTLASVLVPVSGDSALDRRIRAQQGRVARGATPAADLERLGWLFVERARAGHGDALDLALQCARAIESHDRGSHAALLLRGHVLHNQHRFADAERIARKLVAERGLSFDWGLLGDALIDLGRLDAAASAYQRMMDLRPGPQAYARAAHVRHLQGDLPGAVEAMTMAARAASPRNRDSFAWTWAKLATYQLEAGDAVGAQASVRNALYVSPRSAAALAVGARIERARGRRSAPAE